ncbi:MAG: dTDP-4-dehydrorhamnose 3,5-epimerase, partial [Geminicoccaceae bacterium]
DLTITNLPDVKLVTPARFGDKRGFFSEIYNRRALAEVGITIDFIQENHAYSADRGTLRGLHFQCPPSAQTKLLRVLRGAVLDVCVDLRQGSPTFGQHAMAELTAETGQQILCPKGFAHGILTLMPHTEIAYKVDAYYAPELDLGVRYDDPDLGIDWPLSESELVLSEKDRNQPWLRDLQEIFTYP